jgi:formyltetrahydrofolate hydrolase
VFKRAGLARAVGWHLEDRVIAHQNSAIVVS